MPKPVRVIGKLYCAVCDSEVTDYGTLEVQTFKDSEGKVVPYGRCAICYAFSRRIANGSDRHNPRVITGFKLPS